MADISFKKCVPVDQAVGMVLPHDITEIVPGKFKGRAFKKGHIIRQEDVEHLKRLGKEHIYVLQLTAEEIHENEAGIMLAQALAGEGVSFAGEVIEGKMAMEAAIDGIVTIDKNALLQFNMLGEVMCATLQSHTPVKKGEQIAATRLIPLVARRRLVNRAVSTASINGGIISVKPLKVSKVGLVITGNEVFYGRIEDRFEHVLRDKVCAFGSTIKTVAFAPDNSQLIASEINKSLDQGVDLVITSGGMSVDPDDVTRQGIKEAGATDIIYGTPVLPGAMFLSARIGDVPILGIPACGMFHKITVLDLVLPRILAGESLGRKEFAEMGHGGLCRNCIKCHYPICSFGK